MTATKQVTIWCDYVGPHHTDHPWEKIDPGDTCPEWTDHGLSRVADTRRIIRSGGWTHRDGKDLCPQHSRKEP